MSFKMNPALICLLAQLTIALKILEPGLKVAIIATNDIHGRAFPTLLARSDTGERYNYGGLVYLASMIDTIAQENDGNVLYLDAGDQFSGGIEASTLISSGEVMNDFYNLVGVKASAIGNHEFDVKPEVLLNYLQQKTNSYNLAANLKSEKGVSNFLPHQKGSVLHRLPNGITIGVIGLSTMETPFTTKGFTDNLYPAYRFLDYAPIVIKESRKLRKKGANAVLILGHLGNFCDNDFQYANRTKETINKTQCYYDEVARLVKQLPEGTVDGIVQGHRHRIAHHYIGDIPFVGTIDGGYYFNVMYLYFSQDRHLKSTKIEGPIPVCERIFQNQHTCNYLEEKRLAQAGQLVHWQFHGKEVVAHAGLQQIYEKKWTHKMEAYQEELVQNQVHLLKEVLKESELANLFTSLMHAVVPGADFTIINPGDFRAEWFPGVIQYKDYYNMFPFNNRILSFDITGGKLASLLSVVQAGASGLYHMWGVDQCIRLKKSLQRAGGWESELVWARFSNGSQFEQNATYRGATIDFLLQGNDDFAQVINKTFMPKAVRDEGDFRDTIKPHLKALKVIKKDSLIDPSHPRIVIQM